MTILNSLIHISHYKIYIISACLQLHFNFDFFLPSKEAVHYNVQSVFHVVLINGFQVVARNSPASHYICILMWLIEV